MTNRLWTRRPAHFWDPATPAYYDEAHGTWNVFSYDDVTRVLNDSATFYNDWHTDQERQQANPVLVGMWATDGQRHRDLRAAATKPFRGKAIRALAAEVTSITTQLLDPIAGSPGRRFDVVSSVARPLPALVICRMLGIDTCYADQMLSSWREALYCCGGTTTVMPPQQEMAQTLQRLLELRRESPQPGLLHDMLEKKYAGYHVAGKPLTDWDIVGYVAMLLWGAIATTSTSVTNAFLFLTEHGRWSYLHEHPEAIPRAVEETLRWYPSFPGCYRRVLQDTEIGGVRIAAGHTVAAWLTSANRDPEVYS